MTFTVEVGEPVVVGEVGGQVRRYVPLLGGTVEGRYTGTIVPGGMDWQTVMPDGRLEISARYVVQLEQVRSRQRLQVDGTQIDRARNAVKPSARSIACGVRPKTSHAQ